MSQEIKIGIPKKLAEFIDKLTGEGYFNSREDFARCSLEIIAELYGLAQTSSNSKSLLEILRDNGKASTKTTTSQSIQKTTPEQPVKNQPTTIPQDFEIIELFSGVSFEFEDALHAKYTMELMKNAKKPVSKEGFVKSLENLATKGKLEKGNHNGKIIWKILERF